MYSAAIYITVLFFACMGITALFSPTSVTNFFGLKTSRADMRNEVRAVYGGFGVAIAGLLTASTFYSEVRQGVVLTVAIALFGMAAGRLLSFAIEHSEGHYPMVFLVVECVLGSLMLYVYSSSTV
jgi:uncharacterized membrane protein YeaQ/YmgE (transglycosylase-associated protein family)